MASHVSTESSAARGRPEAISASGPQRPRVGIGRTLAYVVLVTGTIFALVPFFYTVSVSLMNLTESTSGQWLPSSPPMEQLHQSLG
ncbi:MAG: hypothetical protein HC802_06960 [Caldilineaceae bacterium]|nr:hypothetical protein [Caldilineaceae bacterium]